MDADDPEQYIRDLENGSGTAPEPFAAPSGGQFGGPRWFGEIAKLANTSRGKLMLGMCAVVAALAVAFFLSHAGTTVQGNLVMINSGAKTTIDCNNGNLKLDGDNNTYTVTGHCQRLEVFGSGNHVALDSADTLDVFGDDNAVTYHSGSPRIEKTGNNNAVSQRR
ncbi:MULTISPECIES: DUF3060 domain-containing protein [unclassified Mycobacterium]|uniref:DUF3060 domain-containing protein n=1 Tax=unclassified Mycobacterium TaxID=2642494 RepID=UPI0008007005|nr:MULTISPECIES: DUF3060 domain-containing protein [unclassified Mycobacterium]OBG48937.1 hypothetical protein A5704_07425 [Mycobacterium sp. E735]OBG69603.1 hypothetical protein A5701_04695 [Mycobacterium sp. E3305]OBG81933.1 hypothetical protein A9X05_19585 [Mycobacterium sp. E3298]